MYVKIVLDIAFGINMTYLFTEDISHMVDNKTRIYKQSLFERYSSIPKINIHVLSNVRINMWSHIHWGGDKLFKHHMLSQIIRTCDVVVINHVLWCYVKFANHTWLPYQPVFNHIISGYFSYCIIAIQLD